MPASPMILSRDDTFCKAESLSNAVVPRSISLVPLYKSTYTLFTSLFCGYVINTSVNSVTLKNFEAAILDDGDLSSPLQCYPTHHKRFLERLFIDTISHEAFLFLSFALFHSCSEIIRERYH